MRRLLNAFTASVVRFAVVGLIGVSPAWATGELHIFNWGDYTNPDLIKKFEDKYGVKVTLDMRACVISACRAATPIPRTSRR